MNKQSEKPLIRWILIKAVALVLIVPLTLSVFSFLWLTVTGGDVMNEAERRNMCDRAYYAGKYGELYDMLHFDGMYGEEFGGYHELADAHLAYENFLQWHRAEKKGMVGSAEKVEFYYNEVLNCAENCRFKQNKTELESYANKAKELWAEDLEEKGEI
ncbi:MAG: hypothetical protein IJZ55_04395 [Lachnospiraceae bacterium]|nr:hypothetical protein [Lachnospiraceae bacterium]